MANHPGNGEQEESRRIIDRISAQEGTILGGSLARLDKHLGASDADPNDKVEVWGVGIGRTIALAVTLAVIAWALVWLFSR